MYSVIQTKRFEKSIKKLKKAGLKKDVVDEIDYLITLLQKGENLPAKYKDHKLTGELLGNREFHVRNDLLIMYSIHNDILVLKLIDIGSHNQLFNQ